MTRLFRVAVTIFLILCGRAQAATVQASYYGFESGRTTANGEHFYPLGLTCASRTLPKGTHLKVTYAGRSAICRVNDYGPAAWTKRQLDVSLGMARAIGLVKPGHASVEIEVIR